MSNFYKKEKRNKNLKLFWHQIKKDFSIKQLAEKSELLVQKAKVSGQKTETTNQKIRHFQLTKIGKKGRQLLILSAYETNKTLNTMQK